MITLETARKPYNSISWPELQLETNWKIAIAVFSVHILVLFAITFTAAATPLKKTTQKLIVHTVALKSPPTSFAAKESVKPQALPPAKNAIAITAPSNEKIEEKIAPAEKAVEKTITQEPVKPEAPPEKTTPAEVKSTPKAQPKPVVKQAPKPVAKAVVKAAIKSPPKPQPKPTPVKSKPQTKPAPKVTEQTKSQKEKIQEQQKQAEKTRQKANEAAAKQAAAKQAAAKAQAAKKQSMLNQALSSLDSAGRIDGKKAALAASAAKAAPSGPSSITSLSAESLVAVDATETANCTPAERTYYDELVSRLKLSLKLPEYGEVKLQLTILRSGKVSSIKSITSKSTKNSEYIKNALPKAHLPPFGQNFPNEKEHTFKLTLTNELSY